jgi:hypothetical protein
MTDDTFREPRFWNLKAITVPMNADTFQFHREMRMLAITEVIAGGHCFGKAGS